MSEGAGAYYCARVLSILVKFAAFTVPWARFGHSGLTFGLNAERRPSKVAWAHSGTLRPLQSRQIYPESWNSGAMAIRRLSHRRVSSRLVACIDRLASTMALLGVPLTYPGAHQRSRPAARAFHEGDAIFDELKDVAHLQLGRTTHLATAPTTERILPRAATNSSIAAGSTGKEKDAVSAGPATPRGSARTTTSTTACPVRSTQRRTSLAPPLRSPDRTCRSPSLVDPRSTRGSRERQKPCGGSCHARSSSPPPQRNAHCSPRPEPRRGRHPAR